MNLTASLQRKQVKTLLDWKRHQESLERLRARLGFVTRLPASTNTKSYRLIIPMVNSPGHVGHFFVSCFEFSIHCRRFFTHVLFYDSLERIATRVYRGSTAAKLVQKVNSFTKYLVLCSTPRRAPLLDSPCCKFYIVNICVSCAGHFKRGFYLYYL